jgi:hypothetical protein
LQLLLLPTAGTAAAAREVAALFLRKKIVKLRCVIFIRSIILLVVHGGVEQDNCFLNRHCGIDLPGRQLGDSVTKLRVRLGQSRNHGWPVKTAAAARSHFVDVRGKVENDL